MKLNVRGAVLPSFKEIVFGRSDAAIANGSRTEGGVGESALAKSVGISSTASERSTVVVLMVIPAAPVIISRRGAEAQRKAFQRKPRLLCAFAPWRAIYAFFSVLEILGRLPSGFLGFVERFPNAGEGFGQIQVVGLSRPGFADGLFVAGVAGGRANLVASEWERARGSGFGAEGRRLMVLGVAVEDKDQR